MRKYCPWIQGINHMPITEDSGIVNPMFRIDVTHDEEGSAIFDISHTFTDKKFLCRLLRDFVARNDGDAQ